MNMFRTNLCAEGSLLRIISVLLLLMCISLGVLAAQEDGELAAAKAQEYLWKNVSATRAEAPVVQCTASKSFGLSTMFLFRSGVISGSLVVLAVKGEAAVIGITDNPVNDIERIPPQLRYYMENVEGLAAEDGGEKRESVLPLIATKWNQSEPYNAKTPVVGESQSPTGCVATAVAQIMRYYTWPVKGRGSAELTTYNLKADFGNTIYDWANMPNRLTSSSREEEIEAVSTLMMHVGVASKMSYGAKESAASVTTALAGMKEFFNYRGIYISHDSYSQSGWSELVYDELRAGRPVLYRGNSGGASGHAFVCDGYDNYLFHMNWGWGGYCDGYFKLSYLVPYGTGTGGGNGNYSYNQGGLFGLVPDVESTNPILYPRMYKLEYKYDKNADAWNLTIPGYYCSDQEKRFDAEYGIYIEPIDMDVAPRTEKIWSKEQMISGGYAGVETKLPAELFGKEGCYRIYPRARVGGDTEWRKVAVKQGADHLLVKLADGVMTLSEEESTEGMFEVNDISASSRAYSGKPFVVEAVFTGLGNVLKDNVHLCYRAKGASSHVTSSSFRLELERGERYARSFELTVNSPGEYDFFIRAWNAQKGEWEELCPKSIVVKQYEEPEIALYSKVYVENECDVDLQHVRVHIPLECTAGTFSEYLNISVWNNDGEGFPLFDVGLIQLEAGEKREIIYEMDLDTEGTFFNGYVYIRKGNIIEPLDRSGGGGFSFGKTVSYLSLTDASTFEDPGFRKALGIYDLDKDGRLSNVECGKIESLELEGDVNAISALESFPYMTSICYEDGSLESIDLTNAANVVMIRLTNNKLTEIDLTPCPELMYLYLAGNQLPSIDLASCPKLKYLFLDDNQLTGIDLSSCPELRYLSVGKNKLGAVDLSSCPELTYLNLNNNEIRQLDCSGNNGLETIYAYNNKDLASFIHGELSGLKTLNLAGCAFKELNLSDCINLTGLSVSGNQLKELDLSGHERLTRLTCSRNELASLNVYKYNIEYLDCSENIIEKLDVKGFYNLETLICGNNRLAYIDLSRCDKLKNFSCYNNVRYYEPCEEFWFSSAGLGFDFDVTKTSDWRGAELGANGNYMIINSSKVYYKYDTGNLKFEAPTFTWSFTGSSGINSIKDGGREETIYFNLQGIRMKEPLAPGIYVRKRGRKTDKVIVK